MIFGVILAAIGTIMTVWGHNQQQTIEYQWGKVMGYDSETFGIDVVFYCGLILLIIGVIVLIFTFAQKYSSRNDSALQTNSRNNSSASQSQAEHKCVNCGTILDDLMKFCPNCGSVKTISDTPLAIKNKSEEIIRVNNVENTPVVKPFAVNTETKTDAQENNDGFLEGAMNVEDNPCQKFE